MSPSITKGVVRAAALLVLTASIGAMVMLLEVAIRVWSSPDWYRSASLALCCLAVIPGIVLWKSIAAWRLRPKGIESIASVFGFAGAIGLGFSIAEIVCKVPAPFPKPLATGVISLVLAVIGYVVSRLQVRFGSPAAAGSGGSRLTLGVVTTSYRICRSDGYGIAGALVLLASMFLPEATPQWYLTTTWVFVGALAGAAVFFGLRKGGNDRSVGFTLAVLMILGGIFLFLATAP